MGKKKLVKCIDKHIELEVGDSVLVYKHTNNCNGHPPTLQKITSIGNKYVTIGEGYGKIKFKIESGRQSADRVNEYCIYSSQEGYNEITELNRLKNEISMCFRDFRFPNITKDEIKTIHSILYKDKKQEEK